MHAAMASKCKWQCKKVKSARGSWAGRSVRQAVRLNKAGEVQMRVAFGVREAPFQLSPVHMGAVCARVPGQWALLA